LWWTKWRRGRFSPSTSVSPAIHSTKFSILTITRGRNNRPVSGRHAVWTQFGLHPLVCKLKKKVYITSNKISRSQSKLLWIPPKAGRTRFDSRQVREVFIFSTVCRPALGPTQPHIQRVLGALLPGVKRVGGDADHSPLASAEVINGGAIPQLLHTSSWRDNFTTSFTSPCISRQRSVHTHREMLRKIMVISLQEYITSFVNEINFMSAEHNVRMLQDRKSMPHIYDLSYGEIFFPRRISAWNSNRGNF
jgi:hypothetical protein